MFCSILIHTLIHILILVLPILHQVLMPIRLESMREKDKKASFRVFFPSRHFNLSIPAPGLVDLPQSAPPSRLFVSITIFTPFPSHSPNAPLPIGCFRPIFVSLSSFVAPSPPPAPPAHSRSGSHRWSASGRRRVFRTRGTERQILGRIRN